MEYSWNKPVLTLYRERKPMERDPFVVAKARELRVTESEEGRLNGRIVDFFELMGSVDCLTSKELASDRYIICWFDDNEEDQNRAARRLTGVTFLSRVKFTVDSKGKRTYNGDFKAEYGKLR